MRLECIIINCHSSSASVSPPERLPVHWVCTVYVWATDGNTLQFYYFFWSQNKRIKTDNLLPCVIFGWNAAPRKLKSHLFASERASACVDVFMWQCKVALQGQSNQYEKKPSQFGLWYGAVFVVASFWFTCCGRYRYHCWTFVKCFVVDFDGHPSLRASTVVLLWQRYLLHQRFLSLAFPLHFLWNSPGLFIRTWNGLHTHRFFFGFRLLSFSLKFFTWNFFN